MFMTTYDIRAGSILFKHTVDPCPDQQEERFQPHTHEIYELLYFISGDAYYKVDGKTYELRSGTMVLIKPGIIHNIVFKSNKPYERITIRFSDTEIPNEIRTKLQKTENIYFVRNTQLSNEITRLDVHFNNVDHNLILYTFKNSLNVILSYLVNYKPIEKEVDMPENIKTIIEYVDDHLTEIDNLKTLCEDLHISRSALCKMFSEGYGLPIMTYVRLRRCVYASSLIEKGEKPTEVYEKCGFNDYASFFRAFKKYTGRTPSSSKSTITSE